jgi:hypothetical protein
MIVTSRWARTALSHRICTGIPQRRLGKLIAELADPWTAQQESRLRERRGGDRVRAPGAGPGHDLTFTDRVIAALVVLRFQLPHAALALFYNVDRATITRAVGEIRPLLAARVLNDVRREDVWGVCVVAGGRRWGRAGGLPFVALLLLPWVYLTDRLPGIHH